MVFVTGDTHARFLRFNTSNFPEQKQMSKDDYVIVCGDFGAVWQQKQAGAEEETYWLDWLQEKQFSLLFVDGNHENYTRLNSAEFETVDFCGGKAQKIRDGIYHLLRGQVYEIQGKRFFTFGGASSHDIADDILDPADFATEKAFRAEYRKWNRQGKQFRVKGVSWWSEELPSEAEMQAGIRALEAVNWEVGYVITHCLPHDVAAVLSGCTFYPDRLTLYFNDLLHKGLCFERWYCGHYHTERMAMDKFHVLYERIERLL